MEIPIAQNVAGQIQELLQISCMFFANWFAFFLHFSCIFLHFNFSYKNGFAFVCMIFAFFLHPDFWGSIFQLHLFCIFLHLYLLLCFPERGSSPTTQH